MKKALAMAVFAVAALPVMAQQVKYSIQGECPADAQMVYVADRVSGTPIDSVATSNGKFAIEGNYQKDALLFVKSNVSKWLVVFFNDGAPINIDLKTNTLKGSAQNESLNYYDRQNDSLTMKMSGLQNQLLAIYNDQSLSQEQKEEKLKAKVSELQPEANKLVASTNELMDKMLKEMCTNSASMWARGSGYSLIFGHRGADPAEPKCPMLWKTTRSTMHVASTSWVSPSTKTKMLGSKPSTT